MLSFRLSLALCATLIAQPAISQPIPENELCLVPTGIGAMKDGKCRALPGDKRKIVPEQLPLHLRNDFRLKLRVVSDDKPDEPYDLSSLYNNDTVTELDLYREGPIDLGVLSSMQALRALSLSIDAAKALDQLATPPSTVRDLRLYAPRDVLDLSPLKNWTGLQVIYVTAKGITGQEALAHLTDLRHADFDLNTPTDLSVLSNAPRLESLDIRGVLGTQILDDVSFLSGSTELRHLSIYSGNITDLSPLAGLTKLRTLILSANSNLGDISVVRNMPDLRNLQLRHTKVADLSPLRGLQNLRILWLDRTPVSDIGPLAETPTLWALELSRTKVTDISPLEGLPLQHLNLRGTQVTDFSVVAKGTKLKK